MDNMDNKNETFTYTYTAKKQYDVEEVKKIREKYIDREENKMETLRRLDRNVEKSGTIISLIVGILSSLLLGTGMACIIEWTDYFAIGLAVGIVGIIGALLAFPIYKIVTKRQREKIMPQIMQLSDELMQNK